MNASELEAARAAYRKRSEALESARHQETAELTDERAVAIIKSLRPFAPFPRNPLNGMGLVEQQAIFHGKKKK